MPDLDAPLTRRDCLRMLAFIARDEFFSSQVRGAASTAGYALDDDFEDNMEDHAQRV